MAQMDFPDLSMAPDDSVDSIMTTDNVVDPEGAQSDLVDPTMAHNDLVDLTMEQDTPNNADETSDSLTNTNEYCSTSSEGSQVWSGKIRGRGESCTSLQLTPPSPKLELPQLQLPQTPESQDPSPGGFSIPAPFIRNPRCYSKLPYCCPSGSNPDGTMPDCLKCRSPKLIFSL